MADTALGDLDHDGRLELVAADQKTAGSFIYDRRLVSPGPPPVMDWTRQVVTTTGSFSSVAIGDVNNDGDLDIVAAGGKDGVGLHLWTGRGELDDWRHTSVQTGLGALTYSHVDLADADHDGFLEILAAGTTGLRVWRSDRGGAWIQDNGNLPLTENYPTALWGHVDHDGNPDIVAAQAGTFGGLRLWAAADGVGPTITPLSAGKWISATQNPVLQAFVLDTGTGVSTTSGLYRYSTDGGSQWSGWLAATMTGSNGSTAEEKMTTSAAVPFGQDSKTENVIRFQARDMAGNVGLAESPVWIDTVAPVVSSINAYGGHDPGTWSASRYITVSYGANDATSGVENWSGAFTKQSNTVPPAVITLDGTPYAAGPLSDGDLVRPSSPGGPGRELGSRRPLRPPGHRHRAAGDADRPAFHR